MDKNTFEKVKKAYGAWATWALWSDGDICDTAVIENNIALLQPDCIFVGLNASRDLKGVCWSNYHLNYKADRNMRKLLNNTPFRGAYITDLFKGKEYVGKKSAELLNNVKKDPKCGIKAIKVLDEEIAVLGAQSPRFFLLGSAVQEIFKRCVPERLNLVPLMHPSDRNGKFLEHNEPILQKVKK